jgi:hypothetical protein
LRPCSPQTSASRSSISRRSLTCPSPARIGLQPIAVQRLGFSGLAQFEIRLRQGAPPVLGHQVVFRRRTVRLLPIPHGLLFELPELCVVSEIGCGQ